MIEPARPPAEPDLAARLAADLDGAFEELVVTHQDRLYAFLLGMTRDGGQAEDLTQETFWKAYRALRRYPATRVAELRLGPWLRRIALNTQRNAVRGKRVGLALVPDPPQQADPSPEGNPEALALRRREEEGLLRALRRYPASRVAELRLGPWLRRIALNTQRNAVRGRRLGQALVPDPPQQPDPSPEGDPEALAFRRREQEGLLRALGTVSASQRAAILLRHAEDLPVEEVATILRLPEGTVKSHVHRGLARLRRALEEEEA